MASTELVEECAVMESSFSSSFIVLVKVLFNLALNVRVSATCTVSREFWRDQKMKSNFLLSLNCEHVLLVSGIVLKFSNILKGEMEFLFKGFGEETAECPFNEQDIQRCPFLRNINKPTNFTFTSLNFPLPIRGAKGPIFEDEPTFDMAYKLFHGKDGVVPLSGRSSYHGKPEPEPALQFDPLPAKTATISLSMFGPGGPFSFNSFSEKWKKQKKKSESSSKRESSSQGKDGSKHEALGNEWLETGNCPIAKSYRAVSSVLPLVAKALRPPPGMKLRCPPAVVAARAALAQTGFVKSLRPQPLPAKMLVIALLGMAVNVPLGIWREHTRKFSLSWFTAVHAAVPFIAMLRKSVLMPKTAMALTIAASVVGQVIGSRAERLRLKTIAEKGRLTEQTATAGTIAGHIHSQVDGVLTLGTTVSGYTTSQLSSVPNAGCGTGHMPNTVDGIMSNHCGATGAIWDPLSIKNAGQPSSSAGVCF
ncbi:hypothetical protein RJ641_000791 [Dillenia turbinata]|uniref:Uncharacterized protein n=1 Tax=Dillenia turbinata TaxID=194707 RepID=A0AAN8W6Z1_9MAGN